MLLSKLFFPNFYVSKDAKAKDQCIAIGKEEI